MAGQCTAAMRARLSRLTLACLSLAKKMEVVAAATLAHSTSSTRSSTVQSCAAAIAASMPTVEVVSVCMYAAARLAVVAACSLTSVALTLTARYFNAARRSAVHTAVQQLRRVPDTSLTVAPPAKPATTAAAAAAAHDATAVHEAETRAEDDLSQVEYYPSTVNLTKYS
jgi:hypothetical protein